jgi:exosortase B
MVSGRPLSLPWLIALAAFLLMFAPSYWRASQGVWQSDEYSHAPIVGLIAVWLLWQRRDVLMQGLSQGQGLHQGPPAAMGWALVLFVPGVLLYVMGRTLAITSAEFVAHWLVMGAIVLAFGGARTLRGVFFAWCYLLFMVPLPGTLVDAVTGPHKQLISSIVVDGLHALGYPTGRAGVLITAGPYQLLVADACSGLNSMLSLAALGALYIHLVSRKRSWGHLAVLVGAILPIAFAANIVRVAALVLITLHFGDEAGQGFLHGAAGMVLVLAALMLFIALDAALDGVLRSRRGPTVANPA